MERDTHVANDPDYDMHGWRVHLMFGHIQMDKLNFSRSIIFDPLPPVHEVINFERVRGETYESVFCELAAPRIQYLEDRARITSRLLTYNNFIWSKQPFNGEPKRRLDRVMAFTKGELQFLCQELPLEDLVGDCAGPNSALMLTVGKRYSFHVWDMETCTRDSELGDIFLKEFNERPESKRLVRAYPINTLEKNAWLFSKLRFYARKHPSNGLYMLYIMSGTTAMGRFPTQDASYGRSLGMFIPYSEIKDADPNDFALRDLAQLLAPSTQFKADYERIDNNGIFCTSYWSDSAEPAESPATSIRSLHADPLVAAVSAGNHSHMLQAAPLGTSEPLWAFLGKGHGTLAPNKYTCEYTTPLQPNIDYVEGITHEPTARKGSFEPVLIDKIQTGYIGVPLLSTFLIVNTVPNFFFRTELAQGRVQLRFCYIDQKTGTEKEVAAELTQWTVLDGDGQIDKQSGIFTPGRTSSFTVIQAVLDDPIGWYWAFIILPIPLITAEAFVAQWNKP